MKVKPQTQILFYDGSPMTDENKKPILLRDLIINSVNYQERDSLANVVDKSQAFEISLKMFAGEEIELSDSDIEFIMKKAEIILVPLALGRLKEILKK